MPFVYKDVFTLSVCMLRTKYMHEIRTLHTLCIVHDFTELLQHFNIVFVLYLDNI
jgi:hypothetical protein